jgi:hypothetical protein
VTCTVNCVVPVAVGVPVMAVMGWPVTFALFVVMLSPAGSEPLDTLQV